MYLEYIQYSEISYRRLLSRVLPPLEDENVIVFGARELEELFPFENVIVFGACELEELEELEELLSVVLPLRSV